MVTDSSYSDDKPLGYELLFTQSLDCSNIPGETKGCHCPLVFRLPSLIMAFESLQALSLRVPGVSSLLREVESFGTEKKKEMLKKLKTQDSSNSRLLWFLIR